MTIQKLKGAREPVSYAMSCEAEGRRALEALGSAFPSHRERAPGKHTVYLDTFDWRLFRQGLSLSLRTRNRSSVLSLESNDDAIRELLPVSRAPAFARDIPDGPMHDRIAPVIAVRRLLPLARVDAKIQGVNILDEQEKTVARVQLVCASAATPGNGIRAKPLHPKLQVVPVRGYSAALRRVTECLEQDLGLSRTPGGTFEEALEIVGQQPGGYSSKLDVHLDAAMTAGGALTVICRTLLDSMLANEDGVRRDLDSEFLHDFRVAGRRTRSMFAQLGKAFAPEALDHFRSEFKWLGSVTGPVRDLDVHLLHMDDYCASLPESASDDLAPLARYLRNHRSSERRRLTAALRSKRYRALVSGWREYLDGPPPGPAVAPLAGRAVLEVASDRIRRAYRKVTKRARAIASDASAESLHRLRLDCKKLRYLLEFFHSLYDPGDIVPLLKELKRLQENLGDFNDLAIQEKALQRFAHEMEQEQLATVDSLLAIGRLLDSHERGQRDERRRFAKCVARFDRADNRERFRRAFGPAPG